MPRLAFAALWPETARSELRTHYPGWRRSARGTTTRFATAVFDWDDPTVRAIHGRFATDKGTRVFAVSPHSSGPAVEVHAQRVVDSRHWSVTYLWGFGRREPHASVSIASTKARVAFGYWGRARSASLFLWYGRHHLERTATKSAEWSLPISFPLTETGAVIVLFRDASGSVYTGWGTPLPAGPFAAG